MTHNFLEERSVGGFNYENCVRNQNILSKGLIKMKARKTGTTIVGVTFRDGVILAADTRGTEGDIIADKNCFKIHHMSDNMYCCGAGTAADTMKTTQMVSSQIELHKLNSGRQPRVLSALRMLKQYLFQYQGYIGAALILGGVDCLGPHLYSIAPHGSTDTLPYQTMGSGCLAALSVLETYFKENMTKEEAIQLARDAVAAGILNDLGSGSNVDICVITKDGAEIKRSYDVVSQKGKRTGKYCPKKGQTMVLKSDFKKVEYDVMTTRVLYDKTSAETVGICK